MTTLVNTPILGLEFIQRGAVLLLAKNLNPTIEEIAATMDISDQEFATAMGRTYVPTVVEPIEMENFYEGHRPSLIEAPIEKYPNVAAWTVEAVPSAESAELDHQSSYINMLYVEVMVKSEVDEEEVNRRVARTAESVHACILRDPTFGGILQGLDGDPTVRLADVFVRRERTSYGDRWFWQGARLEYAVRKEAVLPSSSTGSIFRSGPPQYEIDQY